MSQALYVRTHGASYDWIPYHHHSVAVTVNVTTRTVPRHQSTRIPFTT